MGVLGSGLMGGKLGTLFARAGHEVVFSYERSRQKLERLARAAQGNAGAGTPGEAARDADALLLAVHWSRIGEVLKQAGDVSGKLIVTCSLHLNAENTELVVAHNSSGAEELAEMAPRARVVCGFNTIPSEVLFGVFEAKGNATAPSLVYCGDDRIGKRVAAELIRDVGFDPVDAGPLRMARYAEPFALLVAHLAYEGRRGRNWRTGSSGSASRFYSPAPSRSIPLGAPCRNGLTAISCNWPARADTTRTLLASLNPELLAPLQRLTHSAHLV